eukprot:gene11265-11415_t
MGLWSRLKRQAHGHEQVPFGDAVCVVDRVASSGIKTGSKLGSEMRHLMQLMRTPGASLDAGNLPCEQPETPSSSLADLPSAPAFYIWRDLPSDSKRALRYARQGVDAAPKLALAFAINDMTLDEKDLKRSGNTQLGRIHKLFPDLDELHLQLGNEPADKLADDLRHLKGSAGMLTHLHSFSIDSKLRGAVWQAVARFIVLCPSLQRLSLPNQHLSTAADQRILAAVVEALPGLTHLDLGSSAMSSISTSTSNAIASGTLRRICRLRNLHSLSCNLTAVPDAHMTALSELSVLQSLSVSAAGDATALAAALHRLHSLVRLELEHPSVGSELAGCLEHMSNLRVLALGLCPKLKDNILPQVSRLQQLEKLTLPFPLSSSHLQLLSKLSKLSELFSWRSIELDVLGPSHAPLRQVTKLVASCINSHGKGLGAWFPGIDVLCLKRCNDMVALSLQACTGLQVLHAGDCAQLTNEGLANLRTLKSLHKLHMESAGQITDTGFASVFSSTMPGLHSISMDGASNLTDHGLQLLTASCRRLRSISISSCKLLTDKTLKRLAHCEHLTHVVIKNCKEFTAAGVAALAAAPHMKVVTVVGCSGVVPNLCKGHRAGVSVRVVD